MSQQDDLQKDLAATEKAAAELLKTLELRRLIGDPRVRVQVPTDCVHGDPSKTQQTVFASRRYSIG